MTIGSPLLALIAGILSILSPCVLPILPVVLGAAASEHRHGPFALAAGLSLSFVVLGLFLATVGHSIGLEAERLRYVAAALIMTVGAVLLLPPLQARLALAGGPVGNWADSQFGRFRRNTVSGNSGSERCWGQSGARVSVQRWGRPRCRQHRDGTSRKLL